MIRPTIPGVSAETPVEVRFALGHACVAVRVADAATADAVAGLFRPLLVEGRGSEPPVGVLEIGRTGRGWTLRQADAQPSRGNVRRFTRFPSLLAALEFWALARLLVGCRDRLHLHGAGAAVSGGAVLALGTSGAGKSSLALAWSRAGHALLSDDILLVDEAGRVSGVPRLVKGARTLLRAHGVEEDDTVAPDPGASALWWDPAAHGAGWARAWLPPLAVARVHHRSGPGTEVERIGPAEGLRVLLDGVMGEGLRPEEGLERLATIAERALFLDVRFGSAEDAARTLADLAAGADRRVHGLTGG